MGITVSNLTKIYGTQVAVNHLNFQVETGEIVGFLGPNGAGKTTTMKMITGFVTPTEGNVEMDGLNIYDHSLEIRSRIGYLPEHNPLYLDMYVHEYLEFVGRLYRPHAPILQGKGLRQRVAEVIDMTGLGREQHKQLGMLSKGYRQRTGLAQALLHDPPVLILDEPTTGLDPNQIVEIRKLISEIGKEKTILFSTHILPEVEAIASRVLIINLGDLVADEKMEVLRAGGLGGGSLVVEFERDGFDFAPLEALEGVTQVQRQTGNRHLIQLAAGAEVRRALFEESMRQDNAIYELQVMRNSLEDIFRDFTQQGAAEKA